MNCSIKYNTSLRGRLRLKISTYLKDQNINKFFQGLKFGNFDKQVLFTLENYYDLDDNQRSAIDLYTDARNIIDAEMSSKPKNSSILLELLNKIESELHLVVDNTQSTTLESDIESKTQEEIYDKNREDLEEHLKEMYGLDSPTILSMIKSEFYDDINTAVYCDAITGKFVERNNTVLNENIIKLKDKYLNRIKNYLIVNNVSFTDSFYGILRAFYIYFKTLQDTKQLLNSDFSRRSNLQTRLKHQNTYYLLKREFERDLKASNWLKNNRITLSDDLFNGDMYSLSYCKIKEYLLENSNEQLLNYIDLIEEYDKTLLNATTAYTMLSQFDNMLIDALGKDIAIQPGTKNIELADKYSHHQDTSHETKGWQTSEDISSEKHTAKKVHALFSLIRIFDHKNNTFKNTRLSITPFIMASRHLIDDIIYGKINVSGTMSNLDYYKDMLELCIVTFHNTPIDNLLTILTLLFDTSLGNEVPIKNLLANKKTLTDYDLDILYSIYKSVFDKKNSASFYNQTLHEQYNNKASHGLMEEIAAYVQNNVIADYLETSIDLETNETKLSIKRKFFSDLDLLKLRKNINHQINQKDLNSRNDLQEKYKFTIKVENTATNYSIKLGDNTINFYLGNAHPTLLMGFPYNNPLEELSNLFEFKNIDLYTFSLKILNDESLTSEENKLHKILKFIDDYLDIGILTPLGLQTLQTYENIYLPKYGMNQCLMPLFYLATRAAYINYQYIQAGDLRLIEFLKDDDLYRKHQSDSKLKLFTERFKNVKYVAVSYRDFALETWVNAQALLSGKGSKSTTKDGHGNSIPNSSVGKLGGNIHYQLHKQKTTNCDSLLFVSNPKMITGTVYDLEAFYSGKIKSIKNFSCNELFHHSIFHKFWGSYIQSGHVIIQPTTYSDKTTFLNWEILPKINDKDLLKDSNYVNTVLKLYKNTLGTYYDTVYNDTISKLNKLTNFYNDEYDSQLTFQELLNILTEQQLIQLRQDYFNKTGKVIDLEKDKDYRTLNRVNPDGSEIEYCAFNETLEYYKHLYSSEELLKEALLELKYNFLQDLIDYNVSFLVLGFNDELTYYTTDNISSKASKPNAIMNIILKIYSKPSERIAFFKNWVDSKTGKLILAKLGNSNILGSETKINSLDSIILNPLLDKFFYIEGLFSNNLRMSLTGSEMNHPNKINDTLFNTVKNINDVITFNIKTNFNISDNEFQQIKSILNNCNSVNDLSKYFIDSNTSVDNILKNIYTKSVIKIINGLQGALFKRNVIIPATLLYVKWEPKNGVSKRIKVAVNYDKKADVFNYRGDKDRVDSSDGSAYIDPFLSILENMSLGSQAVGFIKKPIWHGYDTTSGTAFLAKFATTTITNESMRASLYSKTSLFNLFKKMTNIAWDNSKISLTKPIQIDFEYSNSQDALFNNWFNQTILEGLKLFYENLFGEQIQILSLNKEIGTDGKVYYYTEEKAQYNNSIKVYHMFDKYSNHYTFDSIDKAQKFSGHTIQSLFELHTSLGSIYCVDSKGKPSEFNNQVVVNYMNNIGWRREGVNPGSYVSQKNYEQPLKELHIGYVLNNTAVKNGAKNINPASAWDDDSKLNYFEVDSDGLGMQMNADHDIVNSELTEFSQVIAATAAYGYTYDNCNEIFKGLAKTAIQASKQVLDAIDKFLDNFETDTQLAAKSDLYDAIGRIILTLGKINTSENLTNIIKEAVWKIFNKHKDHKEDQIKIPFSDPNIYSDFISIIASTITKDSIKRKHPGSGCVMVPSYDIITYFEIGDKKYSLAELVKIAKNWFLKELINRLKQLENYNQDSDELDDIYVSNSSLDILIQKNIDYNLFSDEEKLLYTIQDVIKFNKNIVNLYLNNLQSQQNYFNKEYFQPEDVVVIIEPKTDLNGNNIIDEEGNIIYHEGRRISLDSMLKYYDFKDHNYPNGTKFLLDVKTPRNLKPSLIRWRYVNSEGNETYMNIFDHPVIKDTFVGKGKLDSNYRKNVQKVLHDLHKGFFEIDGIRYNIIPNSLENTEAELIMSNIYLEIFDTEGESLLTILDQGEDYFKKQIKNKLIAPLNKIYDLALLKDNGKHTLIRFNPVKSDANCIETPFNNISVDENDDIYCMKGNKPLFKIGKYIDINDPDIYIDKDDIKSTKEIDKKLYRIKNNKIQKRIDFVLRYKVTSKSINKKTREEFYTTNTLYALSSHHTFESVYNNNADNEINKLIKNIYLQDNYKFIELNALRSENYVGDEFSKISNYLIPFILDFNINQDHRNYLLQQLDQLNNLKSFNFSLLVKLKKDYYEKEAHRKWISFQDSLKFISSRIPAQTLQSFMAMKCIGWVENTKNMAYVSHFQIYLQGSDYDIDKAYIMGQSYDDNGVYINWSPLFDYTNVHTLALSKQLPIPESIALEKSDIGIDITAELNTIINNLSDEFIPINDESRLIILQNYIQILRKINQNFGKINYDIEESDKLNYVLEQLLHHLEYIIPENIAESAYKNVASANIYTVSHDIRNRDLAYTAIAMDILKKAAKKSPKGEKASKLNMFNPLTKYIMQFQNLVGKNVISIAANGEKVWFNGYYYWIKLLKEKKGEKLKFKTTLNQVLGRAKATPVPKTVTYLPDLNILDAQIKQYLIDEFDLNPDTEEYAYVDLLISLLLSAATDNAKELILAKINAGSNFARMYVYLIMSGYNFDDIVSFMVSPISEFIDSMSHENMFQEESADIRPHTAIDLALGIVRSKSFLRGRIMESIEESETISLSKIDFMKTILLNKHNLINRSKDELKQLSLDELMSLYILHYAEGNDISIISLSSNKNTDITSYLAYCLNIAIKLRQIQLQYKNNPLFTNISFLDDAKEFKKIYNLATEISGISSAWLGLNQGIPTDELGLLKRFSSMKSVISLREKALGIFSKKMFSDTKHSSESTKENLELYLQQVIAKIKDNNNLLSEEFIRQTLENAHQKDLIGTFDVYRYLTDVEYKNDMIEYVQLIKGTFNVLDMMEEIPLYNSIMQCLRAVAVSKYALSSKNRLISQLVKDDELDYLSDKQLTGIINYVDKLNVVNFLKKNNIKIQLSRSIEGFDMYFAKLTTDIIDLTTFEGMATFKHWIENEFFSELKSNYSMNPLVKHLKLIDNNDLITIGTDIDLMNPELTSITLQSYNEILQGMAIFETIPYQKTGYAISDLFLLYNLIININRYGSERLTTTFKACSKSDSILNKYFQFIAKLDYNHLVLQDYEMRDYYINAAPIVYPTSEKYQDAPFIKIKDPEKGYILKRYIEDENLYVEHPLFPTKANDVDYNSKLERWLNFAEYCPFEMPEQMKIDSLIQVLVTDNIEAEQIEQIKNILLDYSGSGKLFIIRDC